MGARLEGGWLDATISNLPALTPEEQFVARLAKQDPPEQWGRPGGWTVDTAVPRRFRVTIEVVDSPPPAP